MGNLPIATPSKNAALPAPTATSFSSRVPPTSVLGLWLAWPCADDHSCCVLMCIGAMPFPEVSSPLAISYTISSGSLWCSWASGWNVCYAWLIHSGAASYWHGRLLQGVFILATPPSSFLSQFKPLMPTIPHSSRLLSTIPSLNFLELKDYKFPYSCSMHYSFWNIYKIIFSCLLHRCFFPISALWITSFSHCCWYNRGNMRMSFFTLPLTCLKIWLMGPSQRILCCTE